ncbi:MAG: phosphatase PAP2 family protein [Bacteroidia bacterium]
MIEAIKNLDRKFFFFINGHHHTRIDYAMFWLSNELIWIPFYLLLVGLIIYFYRKKSWIIIGSLLALFAASDQLSVLIKNAVKRYRPCHNELYGHLVHTVKYCGGEYGFVSSHAANTFALATFITLLMKDKYEYFGWLMFCWAGAISYSRIYLGVHYPADVTAGAILGISLGYVMFQVSRFGLRKIYPVTEL